MSREIKFRGLTKESNTWECGYLIRNKNNDYFIHFYDCNGFACSYVVYPETISQYTGLKDKNGKEIFEGDIVKFEDTGEEGYEYKEGFEFNNIAEVVFENGKYTLTNFAESDNSYYADDGINEILEEVLNGNCEVIGNNYEDNELLESDSQ